jgi:hypothetical protein
MNPPRQRMRRILLYILRILHQELSDGTRLSEDGREGEHAKRRVRALPQLRRYLPEEGHLPWILFLLNVDNAEIPIIIRTIVAKDSPVIVSDDRSSSSTIKRKTKIRSIATSDPNSVRARVLPHIMFQLKSMAYKRYGFMRVGRTGSRTRSDLCPSARSSRACSSAGCRSVPGSGPRSATAARTPDRGPLCHPGAAERA